MKILVCADMEGISGVVDWDHVDPAHAEYARFRRIMTADVNAAIRGALAAGADEVLVSDGHEYGRNILIEELHPRASLNCGDPSPLAMVQGVETGVQAALFVGFHARYGAPQALLSHTWSGLIRDLYLNDILIGETGLCAAVCAHFKVPVIFISGDDRVCAEARDLLGSLETAVVKRAISRKSAECLPLESSWRLIQEAAFRAVEQCKQGIVPLLFQVPSPVRLTMVMMNASLAEAACKIPGVERLDDTRLEVVTPELLDAYRLFRQCAEMDEDV